MVFVMKLVDNVGARIMSTEENATNVKKDIFNFPPANVRIKGVFTRSIHTLKKTQKSL